MDCMDCDYLKLNLGGFKCLNAYDNRQYAVLRVNTVHGENNFQLFFSSKFRKSFETFAEYFETGFERVTGM